jgi:hypothetical protein
MRNKIITLAIMLASIVIILPASSFAASGEKAANLSLGLASEPQIKIRIGKGRRHHGNRGHRRFRMVKQVYWDHGHKRVRWVKQYY